MFTELEAQFALATKNDLKVYSGRMIPGTHYPMFPGGQFQGSVEEIRALIKKQKRAQGVPYTTVAGGRITVRVPVSANARMLLGYRVFNSTLTDKGTLQVNNEVVVNNVLCSLHNPNFTNMMQEYVPIPRPLSGQDQILFTVLAVGSSNGHVEVFFL